MIKATKNFDSQQCIVFGQVALNSHKFLLIEDFILLSIGKLSHPLEDLDTNYSQQKVCQPTKES